MRNDIRNEFKFCVVDCDRGCVATCQDAEEAAMLCGMLGELASVQTRDGALLYSNLSDGDASESYDEAAQIMHARLVTPLRLVVRMDRKVRA